MTARVLITGACGFLGRHVARTYALAGHAVRGLGHGSWTRQEWQKWGISEWHTADINRVTIASLGGKPDLIIHCAGSAAVGFSLTDPSQDFDRTVVTTREVLEYARLYGPGVRVVLPSSASVYGDATNVLIPETAPLKPVSPYGVHKQIAEELCLSYSRHFGISVAIVRFFSVYGIGLRKQLLWDACKKLSRGPAIFCGTGNETRDWLHVEDASQLLLTVGLKVSSNRLIINGATGLAVPIRRVVDTIARAFGHTDLAKFSGKRRLGDPIHLVADIARAESLPWKPNRILAAELTNYLDWFKAGAA